MARKQKANGEQAEGKGIKRKKSQHTRVRVVIPGLVVVGSILPNCLDLRI